MVLLYHLLFFVSFKSLMKTDQYYEYAVTVYSLPRILLLSCVCSKLSRLFKKKEEETGWLWKAVSHISHVKNLELFHWIQHVLPIHHVLPILYTAYITMYCQLTVCWSMKCDWAEQQIKAGHVFAEQWFPVVSTDFRFNYSHNFSVCNLLRLDKLF